VSVKGTTLVGLDVDAAQRYAAVLDLGSGELSVSRLRVSPIEVVPFLEGLGPGVRAVYEAGPTGFGLARAARGRGIEVEVVAPGSIPRGSDDRVKTDRRDAIRLARLLAAGGLRFAFVPALADEHVRDLIRSIEDVRGDLMRARHRLSRFVLRRGERSPGPSGAWTLAHLRWLRSLRFDDLCSQLTLADDLAAVELVSGRRATLLGALEQAIPGSSHAPLIARLRCFRGIDTLSAAGLCAEIGDFRRFPRPSLLSGFAPNRRDTRPPPARPRRTRDRDRLARTTAASPALAASPRAARQTGRPRHPRLRTRTRHLPPGVRNP
jgi:transposase